MYSVSTLEAARDAAEDLGIDDEARPSTFAAVVAGLASEGYGGRAADALLSAAMDGYDNAELAAAKRAAKALCPWAAWDDTGHESAGILRQKLRQHAPAADTAPPPGGVRFALDEPPTPPKWIVPDFLVRGKAHMLSGPTHVFKTGLREAMMAASLCGRHFLGRDVPPLRWMVLDGENSRADIASRWKALGLTDEHWPNIHLTTREAHVRLGEEVWDSWLTREVDAFKPDVLVIDTVARVCAGVAVNDNDRVAALYANVLVPLVDRHDLALLFSHHARKSGGKAGTDDAALGAAAWAGQAEQTLTIEHNGPLELREEDDGSTSTRRAFILHRPKGRDLVSNAAEHFEVRGRLAPNGALTALEVVQPAVDLPTAGRLVAALEAPLGAPALAQAVELNRTGNKFRRALADALEEGLIVRGPEGDYARA